MGLAVDSVKFSAACIDKFTDLISPEFFEVPVHFLLSSMLMLIHEAVDLDQETFTMELDICFKWKDPRLRHCFGGTKNVTKRRQNVLLGDFLSGYVAFGIQVGALFAGVCLKIKGRINRLQRSGLQDIISNGFVAKM